MNIFYRSIVVMNLIAVSITGDLLSCFKLVHPGDYLAPLIGLACSRGIMRMNQAGALRAQHLLDVVYLVCVCW